MVHHSLSGVLFLDELPEFHRGVLENLRQPLEEHCVTVSRTCGSYTYPAHFMLVCAMNPCKCGYYPDKNRCTCTEGEIISYRSRLSGPLLDRIDMYVETSRVDIGSLQGMGKGESSAQIRERVIRARRCQEARFRGLKYRFNSELEAGDIQRFCQLDQGGQSLMEKAYGRFQMSVRNYHRILKVSRTIADLAGEEHIREEHVCEALAYRMAERNREAK